MILDRIHRGERSHTVRQQKDGSLLDISQTVSPIRDRTDKIGLALLHERQIRPAHPLFVLTAVGTIALAATVIAAPILPVTTSRNKDGVAVFLI